MKKITWYLNRLKAMNMGEICWRFQQKNLQKQERRKYYKENLPVYEFELPDELKNLNAQVDRISINWNNEKFTVFKEQNLFGVYSYNSIKEHGMPVFKQKMFGRQTNARMIFRFLRERILET